jgi:hypothetical protein
MPKSVALPYINHEYAEKEIMKATPFSIPRNALN